MSYQSCLPIFLVYCRLWLCLGLLGACAHFFTASAATTDFPFLQPQFENIGDSESVPYGIVSALVQDKRGLLWIGTQKGLIRYDGYRLRLYSHAANEASSIGGDYVYALHAAQDGRLWVGTNSDGVSVFDPASETFTQFRHDDNRLDSLAAGPVFALLEDAKGGIWVATDQGLDYLPRGSSSFRHFRHDAVNPYSLLSDHLRSLLIDNEGVLWVGSTRGLQRMRPDGISFDTILGATVVENKTPPIEIAVRSLFQAQDGKIWLGTDKLGAAMLQRQSGGEYQINWLALGAAANGLSHAWISAIAQVDREHIWLATNGGGINIVASDDGKLLHHLRHDPALSSSLAIDSVKPMLLDRAGLLWVGTWGGGLQRFNTNNKMVRLLRHGQNLSHGLSHPSVRSVLELANGQLLFGSDGNGIDIFDRQLGLVGGYRAQPKQAGSLPDATVLALAETPDGSLWAGTQQAGVLRKFPHSDAWHSVPGLPGQQVNRFLQTKDGSLWAATNRGVARLSLRAGQTPQFTSVPDASGQTMQSHAVMMVEDAAGRIWVASHNGLWVLEPGAKGLLGIHPQAGQANGLLSDDIKSLLLDKQQRLWLATGKGLERLLRWDGKRAEFEHVGASFGREGLNLSGNLLEDPAGRIWHAQAVIIRQPLTLLPLSKFDGLDIGANWVGAYTRCRDGLLIFGGAQGVALVQPNLFNMWADTPPVVVTELKINGKAAALGDLAQGTMKLVKDGGLPHLLLTPEQRNFALEFAALDFAEPKKNRYRYRLQGYENEWIDTDGEHRRAAYGNLWPGDYVLQVRASNHAGVWSPRELNLTIRVLPAYWQTWWFLLLALVLLSGATLGVYRWRTQRLKTLVAARTADIVQLSKIGQELTATLDTEQAFARVHKQVKARLDAHAFRIGIYEEAQQRIRFVYDFEAEQRLPSSLLSMAEVHRPAVWCVREKRELIVATYQELLTFLDNHAPPCVGEFMQTVVYLPLLLEGRVIGCLSVQSPRQHAYDQDQIEFLHVLASYAVIAIANADAHGALSNAHVALASANQELDHSLRHLQETQQQMLLQEKMAGLGTLTAGVAHEINNPTNFVHVAAQNLHLDIAEFERFVADLLDADDDGAGEILLAFQQRFQRLGNHVNTMLSGTERIKGIVKDLRAFTRLDEADKKTVRLSECLHSTLNLVRTSWLDKVEFITDFAVDPAIECWPALLNQVFMNLLVNGCQAIDEKHYTPPEHGQLRLRLQLREQGQQLAIMFEDNGIGMASGTASRVMEPFFTTKGVGAGTGLGLSIAFGIVQKHGGKLEFESQLGKGSCFTVCLPLTVAAR